MLSVGVKTTIDKTISALSAFDSTQFPYAVSKALNDTAYQAKAAIVAAMPSEFTIRRDFIKTGVLVINATKSNLTATVYDRDDFMARQEYGGEKVSINGSSMIAVPMRSVFPIDQVVPDSMRPKNIVNSLKGPNGGNTARVTLHNGKMFLARLIPGAAQGNRLQFLYRLLPSALVKPRFNMGVITYRVVRAQFGANLSSAIAQAMATRRNGGNLS